MNKRDARDQSMKQAVEAMIYSKGSVDPYFIATVSVLHYLDAAPSLVKSS